MNRTTLHVFASVLLLLGLVLLVRGLADESFLWQVGLALVGGAMLFALATQWAGEPGKKQGKEGNDEKDEKD